MNRLVPFLLLALVTWKSGCYAHSASSESDFEPLLENVGHQLDDRFNQVAELTNMVESFNSKLSLLTSTSQSSELSDANLKIKELEAKIVEQINIIENLNSKLNNITSQTLSSSERSEPNLKIKQLEAKIDEQTNQLNNLTRFHQVAELTNMVESFNSKLSLLTSTSQISELSDANLKIKQLEAKIVEQTNINENLTSKLHNVTSLSSSELSDANLKIKQLEAKIVEQTNQLNNLTRFNQMAELTNMVESFNSKLTSCTSQSSELNAANLNIKQLEAKIVEQINIIENLNSKFNNVTTVLSSERSESNLKIKQLEAKIVEQTNQHQNLNSKFSNVTTVLSSERSESNLKIKQLEAKILEKTNQLNNLTSKLKNHIKIVESFTCYGCRSVSVFGRTFVVPYEDNDYGKGWIVFQHRFDGETDFYRNWTEYRNGFGSLNGEFWLGLENIHALTSSKNHELLILLEDFKGVKKYARYGQFAIGGESEGYNLKTLESYSGTAGDSLEYSKGQKFSTFDRDQDFNNGLSCAEYHNGAWWYNEGCAINNLNGLHKTRESFRVKGATQPYMFWYYFNIDRKSLKTSKMMLRAV